MRLYLGVTTMIVIKLGKWKVDFQDLSIESDVFGQSAMEGERYVPNRWYCKKRKDAGGIYVVVKFNA